MTNAEICELMGWVQPVAECCMGDLLASIRKVVEAEREECAKLCDGKAFYEDAPQGYARQCAAAIRARGSE